MRRTVIDDPKNPLGRAIGLLLHHLGHQPPKRGNPRPGFTAPHDVAPLDVPRRAILQGPTPFVLMFDPTRPAWGGVQTGMTAHTGLKARFLLGTPQTIAGTQRLSLPQASREVDEHSSLLGKLRVAGKDPLVVTPRFEGRGSENTPNRMTAHRFPQSLVGLCRQLRQRQPTQGQLVAGHRLAGDRLHDGRIPRGKKEAYAPAPLGLPGPSSPRPSVAARVVPSWDGAAPAWQPQYAKGAAGGARAGPGWRVAATATPRCVDGPSVPPAQGMRVEKRAGTPVRDQTWEPSFAQCRLDSHG